MRFRPSRRHMRLRNERLLYEVNREFDIIPVLTMKFLSQKQEEYKDNLSEFEDKYGFSFRDYELIRNIVKKYEMGKESPESDFMSALNNLKNSKNDDIKEIYRNVSEKDIDEDIFISIMELLKNKEDVHDLYLYLISDFNHTERNAEINPYIYELLGQLATAHHEAVNVYDPSSINALSITSLNKFKHATIRVKDKNDYLHAKQNFIMNEIDKKHITLYVNEDLIDEDDTKYDTIISVCPLFKERQVAQSQKDNKYNTRNKSLIYIYNLLDHLEDNGIIITVIPKNFLVKHDAKELRKQFIEDNILDAVIEYPVNRRLGETHILILNKNKTSEDYLFIKERPYLREHQEIDEKIVETYANREKINKLSNIVSKETIIENDYNLTPKRYVYTLEYEKVPVKKIIEKQTQYSSQVQKLNKEIIEILKQIEEVK